MRIAFITQDFPPETGGIETYSYEICKRLNKVADYLSIFAPQKREASTFDLKSSLETKRIKVKDTLIFFPLIFILPFFIKRNKIDICFHAQWQTLLPSVIAKKMGFSTHIVVSAHARELLLNPFKSKLLISFYQTYKRFLFSNVDKVFPVSNYTADLLIKDGVSEEKITIIQNGTDPNKFFPKNSSQLKNDLSLEGKKIILTVTRLVKRKGIDTVLRALPLLGANLKDTHYVIAGVGPYESSLKDLTKELGIENSVTFTGWVDYQDLNDYYNMCDIFVMPSKTLPPDVEGFGIVFLEANACKKPVIGSNSGGIPSAIINEETGLIVSEDNPNELADAMNRLLTDAELYSKLSDGGYERVINEATWDIVATKINEQLKECI